MQKQKIARDIMVRNLVTLDPEMDLFDAIDLLLRHKISGAPVVDKDRRLVGVFSEKDCLRVLVNAAYEQLPTTCISGFIETDCRTIGEETDLLTIAQLFLSHPFRRLPVVKEGKLIGQISRRDVLRAVNSAEIRQAESHHERLLYLSSLVGIDEPPI